MTKHTVIIYFDTQDPNNPGWAFRHSWRVYDENGDVTEDKEESGGFSVDERIWWLVDNPNIRWTTIPEGWRGTWTEE